MQWDCTFLHTALTIATPSHILRTSKMFNPQLVEWDRVKHIANAVVDSVKQLKLSIETSHTKLNAAMLREQTMGKLCVKVTYT